MTLRILNTIGAALADEARERLAAMGTVEDGDGLTQDALRARLAEVDVAVVGLGLRFDADAIASTMRLRCIATATTGLDHIDLDAARARGIAVLSLAGETAFLNTITGTAELAAGLMVDLLRGTSAARASVLQGTWDRERFRGRTLAGKTLGVVGLGRLGTMVARYGEAFGMRVIASDPRPRTTGVPLVPFAELLAQSDVMSLHVPYTDATRHLMDARALAAMRAGAYLVNTSRGGVVDEEALLAALARGHLAGYATDVLDGEVGFDAQGCGHHPLVAYAQTHANVVITPHIGGMTHESRHATDVFIAEKVVRWVQEHVHDYA